MNININTPPDFFKGLANIYWINLERATDRRKKMEKMFQEPFFQNIPIERIEAFDGSKYNAIELFVLKSEPKITNLEYACLYSHLNSVYTFSQKEGPDDEIALIIEDDMTLDFQPYWRKPIQQIINETPSEWEILQLTYIIDEHMPINEYTDVSLWSTGAYLIKKSAAKKMMDKILTKNQPNIFNISDYQLHEADYLIYTMKTYLYKYPIFIYEYNNNSTIQNSNELIKARNYSKFKLKEMMDENIPPIFFKGINHIYWINLERATDRREKMEKMFQESLFKNIPIQRIEAFDGSKYIAIDFFKMDSEPKMTNIEYACLYSHLESVYKFSQKEGPDDEVALILEDDMTLDFKPYWRKPIQQIMDDAPKDWEVLQLAYIINRELPTEEYSDFFLWSAGAYLMKKSAAKNLINKILVNREPKLFNVTDYELHQADYLIYMSKSYLYKYPVFIYEDNNISYLNKDNSLLLARNYSKNMIKKMMDFELVQK